MRAAIAAGFVVLLVMGIAIAAALNLRGEAAANLEIAETAQSSAAALEPALVLVPTTTPSGDERTAPLEDQAAMPALTEPAWTPDPGSPLALLPLEEALRWRATKENLVSWFGTVPGFEDVRWDDVGYDAELATPWTICREQQALKAFVGGYLDRQLERWEQRLDPLSLTEELGPVRSGFMEKYTNSQDVWDALDALSVDALEHVHSEGYRATQRGSVESRWDLHAALREAGRPSWDAVVEILLRESYR